MVAAGSRPWTSEINPHDEPSRERLNGGQEMWVHRGVPGLLTTPRVFGGEALYLDYDGVAHHEDVCVHPKRGLYFGAAAQEHARATGHVHRLFEHLPLLEALLEPYPQVRIVLSTTWVQKYGFQGARKFLTPDLFRRAVGTTYHSEMDLQSFREASRGMQVWSDVCRRRPSRWLAFDDDHFGWPAWCLDHLVRTDEAEGISAPLVRAHLAKRLEETFSEGADLVRRPIGPRP